MTTQSLWRWGDVEASTTSEALRLTHVGEGAELWIREARLRAGDGYRSASREARRSLARAGAIVRLRNRGRYFVHAAGAVDPDGRGVLLAGDSGQGKSTLAYALARAGWSILGDDGVVLEIREAQTVAHAWRAPLLLSRQLAVAFPELTGIHVTSRPNDPRGRVPVSVPHAHSAPVAAVFFVARAQATRVTRITPVATLAALVRQSPWVILGDAGTRNHLDALRQIASSVPALWLEHSPAALHGLPGTISRVMISV